MRDVEFGRRLVRGRLDGDSVRGVNKDRCPLVTLWAGDRQTFEQLCRECYPHLARFLSLVFPDEPIDDMCINVFAEAWRRAARFPRNYAALTWIIGVGYDEATLRFRRRQAESPVPEVVFRSNRNAMDNSTSTGACDPRCVLSGLEWEARVVTALVYGMRFSMEATCQVTAMTDREIHEHLRTR